MSRSISRKGVHRGYPADSSQHPSPRSATGRTSRHIHGMRHAAGPCAGGRGRTALARVLLPRCARCPGAGVRWSHECLQVLCTPASRASLVSSEMLQHGKSCLPLEPFISINSTSHVCQRRNPMFAVCV